jgi:mono/diheme cytochrome c family protein
VRGRASGQWWAVVVASSAVALAASSIAAVVSGAPGPPRTEPGRQANDYRDGHARPRALAFNDADGLLYVALSTADQVAVVDPSSPPRVVAKVTACRFPAAIVALPRGGALVACRFEPGLRRISRDAKGSFRAEPIAGDLLAGPRGLALSGDGKIAYVASPPLGGVAVVALGDGHLIQTFPTGISPRTLRVVPGGAWPGHPAPLLLVSNFIDHTVTVHPIDVDGRLGPAIQTIQTEAPVLDMRATGGERPALWLFTHEDRQVSRARGPVEGLDSGIIRLAARASDRAQPPLEDPGSGRRAFLNLGDRAEPVIEPDATAIDGAGTFAIAGAGSDNLLLVPSREARLQDAIVVPVGANPSAVAALPGGRFVTADRLSDTITFAAYDGPKARVDATLVVGTPARSTPAEEGELLFYSRALVRNNVATGPLSLYTCAACHADGHIDGRLHPAKQNKFFSTTLTCRGIGTTAPFLRLGNQATVDVFADNIVATHAQGAERDPARFADYPVTLRLHDARKTGDVTTDVTLQPPEVRAALARYMERIPPEPSPFVAVNARALGAEARRGLTLFRDRCAGCHQLVGNSALGDHVPAAAQEARLLSGQVALTSPGRYAVGTPVLGEGGNNPPSLRGVWDAAPYFSDGSARTLEEVLRRTDPDADAVHAPANAARPSAFAADAQTALLAFLRAL